MASASIVVVFVLREHKYILLIYRRPAGYGGRHRIWFMPNYISPQNPSVICQGKSHPPQHSLHLLVYEGISKIKPKQPVVFEAVFEFVEGFYQMDYILVYRSPLPISTASCPLSSEYFLRLK